MVESFLDKQPVDSVRVEYKVGAVGCFVADHATSSVKVEDLGQEGQAWSGQANLRKEGYELRRLWEDGDIVVRYLG